MTVWNIFPRTIEWLKWTVPAIPQCWGPINIDKCHMPAGVIHWKLQLFGDLFIQFKFWCKFPVTRAGVISSMHRYIMVFLWWYCIVILMVSINTSWFLYNDLFYIKRCFTFTTLWANSADDRSMTFFLFFPENRQWHFMQIASLGGSVGCMSD